MVKRFIGWGLLSLLISTTLFAQDDWSKNNRWSLFGEFVFLQRSNVRKIALVGNACKDVCQQTITSPSGVEQCCIDPEVCCPPPDQTVCTARDLVDKMCFEPGFRVGLCYTFGRDPCDDFYLASFCLSFLWLNDWEATKVICDDGCLFFPFDDKFCTCDYFDADIAKCHYSSRFYDLEFNYLGQITPRRENYFAFTGILGLRYIYLREKYLGEFTKFLLPAGCDMSEYEIKTSNNMFGPQLGGDLQWNPTCSLSWNCYTKFGFFANPVCRSTLLRDCNNCVVLQDTEVSKWKGTFMIDTGLGLTFWITPNVNIHGGYQFMWLSGVALAPEQVDKMACCCPNECLNGNGEPIIQGGFLGLSFCF